MNINETQEFWARRAHSYGKLDWATRSDYLHTVLESAALSPNHAVLDVGTGTGIVANAVAPHVWKIVGLDISPAMVSQVDGRRCPRQWFMLGDARRLPFLPDYFDRVFARMVFHHIMEDTVGAVAECRRVLKPAGEFILSEGIPPDRCAEQFYTEMFKLKEERLTFFEETLEDLLHQGGFKTTRTRTHVTPQVSIANWLNNSELPPQIQDQIMQMHREMPDHVKRAYNAIVTDKDILLDMKFAIVIGIKD